MNRNLGRNFVNVEMVALLCNWSIAANLVVQVASSFAWMRNFLRNARTAGDKLSSDSPRDSARDLDFLM